MENKTSKYEFRDTRHQSACLEHDLPTLESGKTQSRQSVRLFPFYVPAVLLALLLTVVLASCTSGNASNTVKDTVNDYSWGELADISREIASAPDDETALEIAVSYHLASADGKLDGTQAKEIEFADGTTARAVIAGFRHDSSTTGERTGITFIFDRAIACKAMNNNAGFDELDNDDHLNSFGGWNASELRAWLNSEFLDDLPLDLRNQLASVVKTSCIISSYELPLGTDFPNDSIVAECVDRMWLPAIVELSGVADDTKRAAMDPDRVDILRKEGAQYQLFADQGVVEKDGAGNESLIRTYSVGADAGKTCDWWLRSTERNSFAHVTANGGIDRFEFNSGNPQGIVPCFSI